jgi:hypothetical protein
VERFLSRVDADTGGTAGTAGEKDGGTREPSTVSPNCRALTAHTRLPTGEWPLGGVIPEEMDAADVLFSEQLATALYINRRAELVIRQHNPSQQEDVIVIVQQENVQAFVDRICDLIGIPSFP